MGFPYASFLLGLVNSGTVNPPAALRTGKHFIAFFAQDSWKITRKLTLNYGLRYDYDTHHKEQYGRLPTLSRPSPIQPREAIRAPRFTNPPVIAALAKIIRTPSGLGWVSLTSTAQDCVPRRA